MDFAGAVCRSDWYVGEEQRNGQMNDGNRSCFDVSAVVYIFFTICFRAWLWQVGNTALGNEKAIGCQDCKHAHVGRWTGFAPREAPQLLFHRCFYYLQDVLKTLFFPSRERLGATTVWIMTWLWFDWYWIFHSHTNLAIWVLETHNDDKSADISSFSCIADF